MLSSLNPLHKAYRNPERRSILLPHAALKISSEHHNSAELRARVSPVYIISRVSIWWLKGGMINNTLSNSDP